MEPQGPIRVAVATDHQLFREGLVLILSKEEGIALVGLAAHALQAVDIVRRLQPDVLLLDTAMSGMDGIDVVLSIKHISPTTKPLVLIWKRDDDLIWKTLKAGAGGYLAKEASVSDLTKAIQAVCQGELWVERWLIEKLLSGESLADDTGEDCRKGAEVALTKREQEVLRFLASGGTNKEIAQSLFISERTVKSHLDSIFRKLQVTSRLKAILYAVERGLR